MQSNEGGLSNTYACLPNFCERMKPCNLNSECIYSKENNTFFCRCLNGAPTCDEFSSTENFVNNEPNENSMGKTLDDRNDLSTNDISASSSSAFSSSSSAEVTTSISEKSDDSSSSLTIEDGLDAKTAENKPQSDIPKLGFNLDNVNRLTIFD